MRFAAFLAYPERYADWARTLHDHLEQLLRNRSPATVFDQRLDLTPGRSRLDQIQNGLEDSGALILVASPETFCSPEMSLEWQVVVAAKKPVVVAMLIDTPLPDFVRELVAVDFREHGDDAYFAGLRQLAASLDSGPPRRPPALPDGLAAPAWPDPGIPRDLRKRLVDWLVPFGRKGRDRRHLERCLALAEGVLDQPSAELSASAALVFAAKDGEPYQELTRIVESLCRGFATVRSTTRKAPRPKPSATSRAGRPCGSWPATRST